MYLVVCTYPNFFIRKMLQRAIATYNLKAVYKISTGRKYYEFYVEMSPNCSILASIFQNFPGGGEGGMPPDPACFACWEACFAHLYPRD